MPDPLPEQPTVASHNPTDRRLIISVLRLALFAAVAIVILVKFRPNHDALSEPPALKATGQDLKHTVITPHLEAPIQSGINVLWCSTFQLVWNEACRVSGGELQLQDEPPIVSILNKKAADQSDVDPDSCLVVSGFVQDGVVAKSLKELERKFKGQADPAMLKNLSGRLPPDGWLGYAYLFRALPFEYAFDKLEKPLDFQSSRVASFGLSNFAGSREDSKKAAQIVILNYTSDNDFILELKPKDPTERIILAKIAPAPTLQKTIETVQSRIKKTQLKDGQQELGGSESFVAPILNFDLLQEYEELHNKRIKNTGPLQDNPIVLAMQSIRFRLDERGAVLKSEAGLPALCADTQQPRQFVFNKPFLILLERRNAARPYFALWIDNPELLVPCQ